MNTKDYHVVLKDIKDTGEVPKDKNLFYRCKKCGGVISSTPRDNTGCECGNIFIDIDFWRLAIKDYALFEVVKKKSKN